MKRIAILALLLAAGWMIAARAQSSLDAKLQGQLKRLFPAATAFSPKEGDPPHFKAFVNDPKSGLKTLVGLAFWTTELDPLERGYDGPIKVLVGMDTNGVLDRHHRHRTPRAVRRLLDRPAGVRGAVQGQEHPRSVQGRQRHRRRLARHDQRDDGVAVGAEHLAAGRPSAAHGRARQVTKADRRVVAVRRAVRVAGDCTSRFARSRRPAQPGPAPSPGTAAPAAANRWRVRRRGRRDAGLAADRRRAGAGPGGIRRVYGAGARQFLPQEREAEVRDVRRVGRLSGLHEEPAHLDRERLRAARLEPADLQVQPGVVPARRVHGRRHGVVGAAVLRPDVRVRRADAADGPHRAAALAPRAAGSRSTDTGAEREVRACWPARSPISWSPATA